MANLASSAVTINRAWSEGGTTGKELSARLVTLVLTGQGGGTNKILASVLSLTKIEQASTFIDSTSDIVIPATPSYDGSYLVLNNLAQGTDADRTDAADITGTIRGVVKGYV